MYFDACLSYIATWEPKRDNLTIPVQKAVITRPRAKKGENSLVTFFFIDFLVENCCGDLKNFHILLVWEMK